MSKRLKFIVKDRTIIELAEDGQKGDTLDISEANQLDTGNFKQLIEKSAAIQAQQLTEINIAKIEANAKATIAKLNAELLAAKQQQDIVVQNKVNESLMLANREKEQLVKELAIVQERNKNAVELAVANVVRSKDDEINNLKVQKLEIENKLKETESQWMHRHMSTKSYGEELEQFVYNEFLSVQQAGAFPNAQFIKDNIVITSGDELKGSKGDFIFKDFDENNNSILTIEIEVKTEQTTNATKKTHNRDHFKKLDEDRTKKDCEYAILVSELEKDNKVFDGIYKVPGYKKMYVVRPQSLITLISILKDSLNKNKELIVKLNQQQADFIDKQTFVKNLQDAQIEVNKSVVFAQKNFNATIEEIDKSINALVKAKEDLLKCGKQLTAANNKVTDITVRKLLKGCKEDPFNK